jgi:CubicO group peptidase (beta-lactamase class C family)
MRAPHTVSTLRYFPVLLMAAGLGAPVGTVTLEAAAATSATFRPGILTVFGESGRLSDEVVRIIERLEKAPTLAASDDDNTPPPLDAPDAYSPAVGLHRAIVQLETLLSADARSARLTSALAALKRARSALNDGSDEVSLVYLEVVLENVQNAQSQLDLAGGTLKGLQLDLALVAQRTAKNILEAARRAGVSPHRLAAALDSYARGSTALSKAAYTTATARFGDSLGFAADTVSFDVRRFEDNIIAAMDGEAVGYALSITFQGQTYNGGHADGQARTAADAPMTEQSPNKDMHVASVSKTLTAIVILHVLEELGLTPEEPVAPYLPNDWVLGDGVADLTFRHFMTHRTGFGQQAVSGSSYEQLRALIAEDVGDSSYEYDNDNFALLRVAHAGLLGLNPHNYAAYGGPDEITAALFIAQAMFLYDPIGVSVDCRSNDPNPTIQYRFPDTGAAGFEEPDHSLTCGGVGWFINANELAGVMSALRNTEQLMSAQMRSWMQDDLLGLMSASGEFGAYYYHAGDWRHGEGELHACVMAFPIVLEAALLINSERGAFSSQCALLRAAFENAWVP